MKKKSLIMLLSAMLVIATAAMGTIAYLTDGKSVTNTFTVGNVTMELDEAEVDEYGKPKKGGTVTEPDATLKDEAGNEIKDSQSNSIPDLSTFDRTEGTEGNEYRLVPGRVYTKDPTVTIKKDSEDVYVRMLVTITKINELKKALGIADDEILLPGDYVTGYVWDKWVYVVKSLAEIENETADEATYEFRYYEPVKRDPEKDQTLLPLFTTFRLPGDKVDSTEILDLNGLEIKVEAHAIQAETFENADEAWKAFNEQHSN